MLGSDWLTPAQLQNVPPFEVDTPALIWTPDLPCTAQTAPHASVPASCDISLHKTELLIPETGSRSLLSSCYVFLTAWHTGEI